MALAMLLPVLVISAIMLWGAFTALFRVARWLWRMLLRPESSEADAAGGDIFGDQ